MIHFALSDRPIDDVQLRTRLENREGGALVVFEGRVRRQNEDRVVARLEYEAFAPLAEKEGNRILEETRQQFDILAVVCVHRTGTLELGDTAVWIGVVTRHRGAAFEACRHVIDEVKERVPIWKKEHYADGDSGWINPDGTQR
jgi:molybdopterin synthase catalytic subunit